jgi:hypothetical protein
MALSTGKFVLGRVISVALVVVGVTGLTWLAVNALRPDLRAGDDRFILVALFDYLQSAFLHFDFGTSRTGSNRDVQDLIREGLPADISLLAGGLAVGLFTGIAGGAYCAARPTSFPARALEQVVERGGDRRTVHDDLARAHPPQRHLGGRRAGGGSEPAQGQALGRDDQPGAVGDAQSEQGEGGEAQHRRSYG